MLVGGNHVKAILQYVKVSSRDLSADLSEQINRCVNSIPDGKAGLAKLTLDSEITVPWVIKNLLPAFRGCPLDLKSATIVGAANEKCQLIFRFY